MNVRRSTIVRRIGVLLLDAVVLTIILICPHPTCPKASELAPRECPDEDSITALQEIMDAPEAYVGCRLIVQGTVYRMQGVDRILYSIHLSAGGSIEVRPWASDEGASSPKRGDAAEDERTMPSYVGHEIRIEGKLVRERDGRVVVEASIVEEINGGSE